MYIVSYFASAILVLLYDPQAYKLISTLPTTIMKPVVYVTTFWMRSEGCTYNG